MIFSQSFAIFDYFCVNFILLLVSMRRISMSERIDNNCVFVKDYEQSGEIKSIFHHSKCDGEYHIAKRGNKTSIPCPRCSYFDKKVIKDDLVRRKLSEATDGLLSYEGVGYKDNKAPIIVQNNSTGNFFLSNNLDNLINKNNKDPFYAMSRFEKHFFKYMKSMDIGTNPFEILSLKINDLIRVDKHSQPLRLDFTLNLLSKPVLAFEIDSQHHFREIYYYDTYSSLKKRIKRDLRKDLHTTSNLLPLVRLTPTAHLQTYNPYNVIDINEESFLIRVISQPQILKRNISFLKNFYISKHPDSINFHKFLASIEDISTRTNPFN